MGNTKPAKIAFDFGNQFKDGVCSAKMSKAVLSFERFISVKAGTFKLGTSTPPGPPCKDKNLDVFITITPAMAKRIREGEIEHCHDAHRAFDLTYGKYNAAAKALEAGFPAKDRAACNAETLARLLKATGIETFEMEELWPTACSPRRMKRDTKAGTLWIQANLFLPRIVSPQPTLRMPRRRCPRSGKHSSAEIVKGCGEP